MAEYTNRMKEKRERLEEFFNRKDYVPMRFRDIASLFQVPKKEREDLNRILGDLIKEGFLTDDGEGRYERVGADIIVGIYRSTKKGYGFLSYEEGEDDLYIPPKFTENAFDGDKVMVKLLKSRMRSGKSREAKILKIIERANRYVVGTFVRGENFGFVVPDNKKIEYDIYIPKKACKNVPKGFKVVAEITDYGDIKRKPEGKIVEIIGDEREKGVDILSIARAFGINDMFPEEVLNKAETMPKRVKKAEMEGRLDLRELKMVTIDGEDAKDLDDAISVTKEEKDGRTFYHLGVHIADVSHYVKEGGELDKEALKRGTSVYLVDRVIPMLPKELSNGICSLNEKVTRLALSCLMKINERGEVIEHEIAETVIKTNHRMTYKDVNVLIAGEGERFLRLKEKYSAVYDMLLVAEELALILRKKRHERGAIDFDFPETKILLDKQGFVKDVRAYDRNEATRLIEDFMLVANETVAEDAFWQELPFIYRSHENPSEEKLKELGIFLYNFGYSLKKKKKKKSEDSDIHPREIQKLLNEIKDTPEEMMISRMTLRSMKRAKYVTESDGHFGLAARYYSHFTSPIRRYPDLQIHRIIKENLRGGLSQKRRQHFKLILDEVANHSSVLERRADEAEREVDKMKMAEYMLGQIGEEFDGRISGVTSWGIYVELPNTIEGMIRINDIDADYYRFDAERMEIVGELTRKRFGLGQKVRVRVVNANKELRTIDFKVVE